MCSPLEKSPTSWLLQNQHRINWQLRRKLLRRADREEDWRSDVSALLVLFERKHGVHDRTRNPLRNNLKDPQRRLQEVPWPNSLPVEYLLSLLKLHAIPRVPNFSKQPISKFEFRTKSETPPLRLLSMRSRGMLSELKNLNRKLQKVSPALPNLTPYSVKCSGNPLVRGNGLIYEKRRKEACHHGEETRKSSLRGLPFAA